MTDALASHLWQSTIFAGVAALLTLAFRVNRAQVRYWLWIGASLKFLIPFALLTSVGSYIQTWAPPIHEIAVCNAGSVLRDGIFQPALVTASARPVPGDPWKEPWTDLAIPGVWLCGLTALMAMPLPPFAAPSAYGSSFRVHERQALGPCQQFRRLLLDLEQAAGDLEQGLTQGGRLYAAPGALQEPHAICVLEQLDLLAEGW